MKKILFLLKTPKLPFRFKFFRYIERLASVLQERDGALKQLQELMDVYAFKIKPKIFIDIELKTLYKLLASR